jgi:hypothetical protein
MGPMQFDAATVLPADWKFLDSRGTFARFSNSFRYELLLEHGVWWVDTDVVCLRPFDLERQFVFMTEVDSIGTAVIHVPPRSALMARLWEICSTLDRSVGATLALDCWTWEFGSSLPPVPRSIRRCFAQLIGVIGRDVRGVFRPT